MQENEVRKIYVFYADVYLLQNFLMDFFALLGVNFYLRRRKKWDYLFLIALLFSVLGLILLLWIQNSWIYGAMVHLVLNTAMVLWAFGYTGKRAFAENWAASYFIVILSGGIFEWLVEMQIPFIGFAGMAAVTGALEYGILSMLLRRKRRSAHIYPVKLKAAGKTLSIQAYWDSGNQLIDPYTGKCVSILAGSRVCELLSEEGIRFHYVPFHSLGEEHGLIRVINVDELLIFDERQVIRLEDAAIGIAEWDLFAGKEYELLLHASTL